MESILLSIVVFTGVILILVLIINFAENKLLPQGEMTITVNNDEDKRFKVRPGGTLLLALANETIYLPSACGGGGTCAMCKCQVLDGGGGILPTETGHISRNEAKANWRLACQVKVKEDMNIHVPDEIFSIRKWECTVKSNENVATFIKELVLDLPEAENLNFQAGGYIQIDIPKYRNLLFKGFDVEDEYHPDWDKYKVGENLSSIISTN